ncbi:hypothetical protein Agub_g9276, partial [Astrephomene gubernaculifera]
MYEIDVGADLPSGSTRPRHLGSGYDNRVIGGLLLYTTRRALPMPQSLSSSATATGSSASSSSSSVATDASCDGAFSDLDASCHMYELSYLRGGTAATSMLQRMFVGMNDSLAPYGVDPLFLRSSALYREDLTSKMDWYYNTSNTNEVGPTGMPYGFSARPLSGRPPGFPVLVETGLSTHRTAQLVRYLADGNYLDRRQTRDLSAEMLVYNPIVHAFAYFRADFTWDQPGSITGRLSAIGFPAMAYLDSNQTLSDALTAIFAHELLPLWVLAAFFAVVTTVSCVAAVMRAKRHVAAAVDAAAAERNGDAGYKGCTTAAEAAKRKGYPASNDDLVMGVSESLPSFGTLSPGAKQGVVPWAHSSVGRPRSPHIRVLRDEAAEVREERLELHGTAGLTHSNAWFREFARHDGGLLYDIPLAVLLIAVAAFWTAIVEHNLALYSARATYRVYDAMASAPARWLLPVRVEPDAAAASNTSALYAAASNLGLDVPSSP